MQKLLVAILLLVSTSAFAQRNKVDGEQENFFRFGAKGGVNVNKISGQSYKEGFNFNFQAGVFLQFNFSNRFGLQPEVNFVQTSSEFSNDASDIYDDLFRDGSQKKAKLNYLEVPVLLNINVGESKRVKLQIGPAYGGLLKQTVDSLKNNGNIYKNGEWAAIGGLWIQLPFVNLGARYKLGLTDLNGIDNRQSWKSQSIQVFVGVTF
jgi:Outer membrane protein beta-barrel domain